MASSCSGNGSTSSFIRQQAGSTQLMVDLNRQVAAVAGAQHKQLLGQQVNRQMWPAAAVAANELYRLH
jgi:hypothetical protein